MGRRMSSEKNTLRRPGITALRAAEQSRGVRFRQVCLKRPGFELALIGPGVAKFRALRQSVRELRRSTRPSTTHTSLKFAKQSASVFRD